MSLGSRRLTLNKGSMALRCDVTEGKEVEGKKTAISTGKRDSSS